MYLRNCRKAGVEVSVTGAYTLYVHCIGEHAGIYRGAQMYVYIAVHEGAQTNSGTRWYTWVCWGLGTMQVTWWDGEVPLAMSHDRSSCSLTTRTSRCQKLSEYNSINHLSSGQWAKSTLGLQRGAHSSWSHFNNF